MKKRLPSELKIGGYVFKVKVCSLRGEVAGETNWGTNTIRIDKGIERGQQEATLIHEIFHVLNPTLDDTNTFGHALLSSFAEQWYQVLKDNDLLKL